MKPVVQEEKTGCAIASIAAIAGVSYKEARKIAHSIGMYAEDSNLWSETNFIRKLIKSLESKRVKKKYRLQVGSHCQIVHCFQSNGT